MAPDKDSLVIALQDPRVYLTGEQVQGNLHLRLKKESKIKNVQIWFSGESFVCNKVGDTTYELKLPLFSLVSALYSRDVDDQNQGKFPAGEFAFPFSFTLPDDVPSSKQRKMASPPNGYTHYTLTATVERSSKSNLKAAQDITVFEKLDVSQPEFQVSKGQQKDKQVCCCCCRGGIIRMNAKLNKWGYYPGETIQTKLYVENMSNRDVTYSEIMLSETTLYQYGKKENEVETKIARIASEKTSTGVGRGQDGDFDCLTLVIPSDLPPSTALETVTIITRSYDVRIIAHVRGSCVMPAVIEFPIMIGSYIPVDSLTHYSGLLGQPNTETRLEGL